MYLPEKLLPETPCNHPLTQDRQDLWDAAQIIRKHGHCKGVLFNRKGAHCWMGAIDAAADYNFLAGNVGGSRRVQAAVAQFQRATGMNQSNAVHWNNHPETTAEDVIFKLEYAALA